MMNGISLRDYFAGQALTGLLAGRQQAFDSNVTFSENYVRASGLLSGRQTVLSNNDTISEDYVRAAVRAAYTYAEAMMDPKNREFHNGRGAPQ